MPLSFLACIGWVVVLVLAVGSARGDDRPATSDLRVMSFNIRYGTAKDGENHWDRRKEFLVDTYRVAHPVRDAAEGTFSNFRADTLKGARIDWIGVSRDWQVVEAAIDRTARDGRTPSDHFPITALLRSGAPE